MAFISLFGKNKFLSNKLNFMKYYLVIVNYNNCNVTIDCILSAGKLIEESFSKIVVC